MNGPNPTTQAQSALVEVQLQEYISAAVEKLGNSSDVKRSDAEEAALTLRDFALHSHVAQEAIAAAGAIPLLVVLLSSNSSAGGVQAQAAEALGSLAIGNPVNKQAIVEAGAVPPLVRLLEESSVTSVLWHAAQAICALAEGSPGNQQAFAAGGAIQPLIRCMLDHASPVCVVNPDGIMPGCLGYSAAAALGSLAEHNPANQRAIASAGAIPPLVQLLRSASVFVTRGPEVHPVSNTIFGDQGSPATARPAFNALLALPPLERPLGRGIAAYGDDCDIIEKAAVAALSSLALNNPANQQAIAAEGAIPPLVEFLRSDEVNVLIATAWAISNIARNSPANQRAFAEADAIALLLRRLGTGSAAQAYGLYCINDSFEEAAAAALGSLASNNPANQRAIAAAGAIPPLVCLLGRGCSDGMQEQSARALHALAYSNRVNQSLVAAQGAIPPLVELLGDGHSPAVRRLAARTLRTLAANHPANREAIKAAGSIPALEELSASSEQALRAEASASLRILSTGEQTSIAVVLPRHPWWKQLCCAAGRAGNVLNESGRDALVHVSRYNTIRELETFETRANASAAGGGLEGSGGFRRSPGQTTEVCLPALRQTREEIRLGSGTEGAYVTAACIVATKPLRYFCIQRHVPCGACLVIGTYTFLREQLLADGPRNESQTNA